MRLLCVRLSDISVLSQILTASLIYHKPHNVRAHLLELLREIEASKSVEEDVKLSTNNFVGSLFSDEDLQTMFNMYDINNTGHITKTQAINGIKSLVGKAALESLNLSEDLGTGDTLVSKLKFVQTCKKALYKVLNEKGSS